MRYQMNNKRDYIMKNIEEKYNYLQNLGYKVIAIYLSWRNKRYSIVDYR